MAHALISNADSLILAWTLHHKTDITVAVMRFERMATDCETLARLYEEKPSLHTRRLGFSTAAIEARAAAAKYRTAAEKLCKDSEK